jgi:PEGA domain
MSRWLGKVLVAFAFLYSVGSTARGEAVLAVYEKRGNADEAALELVKATIGAKARSKGWEYLEAFNVKSVAIASDVLTGCLIDGKTTCVEKALRAAPEVTHVIGVRMKANGPIDGATPYEIVLVYAPRSGGASTMVNGTCVNCRAETLEVEAAALFDQLFQAAAAPAMLDITSDPPGATVAVDGVAVGVTPLRFKVPAGSHVVSFSHEGLAPVSDVTVIARPSEVTPVSRTFAPAFEEKSSTSPLLWTGVGLAAVGVAAVGTGVYLVAKSGYADEGETEPKKVTSAAAGYVAIGGGVAAAAVGTYLIVRSVTKKKTVEKGFSLTGMALPGQVWVGAEGRF